MTGFTGSFMSCYLHLLSSQLFIIIVPCHLPPSDSQFSIVPYVTGRSSKKFQGHVFFIFVLVLYFYQLTLEFLWIIFIQIFNIYYSETYCKNNYLYLKLKEYGEMTKEKNKELH